MTATETEEGNPAQFASWLRFWRWVVAVLQVVGGLCGIYAIAFGSLFSPSRVVFLFFFVLYVAAVWGGVLLALGRRGGVAVSLAVQAFQLFQVNTAGVLYFFACGLQIIFGARQAEDGPFVGLTWFFPARSALFLNPPAQTVPPGTLTGLNVAAALAIVCLLYVRTEERKHISPADTALPAAATKGVWPPAPKP